MAPTPAERIAEILASQSTGQLVTGLLTFEDHLGNLTPDERIVRAAMLEEVERRHPEVEGPMNEWADSIEDLGEGLTYVEALLVALPKEALQ